MSRRVRAAAFLALAGLAAGLAAVLANSYGSRLASGYGPLRPVVVAARPLSAAAPLTPADLARALQVKRVPVRFAPAGALRHPAEAVGLVPAAALPVGSYLVAAQLRPPQPRARSLPAAGRHRRPVEVSVAGAGALLASRAGARGARVDVVVTAEPTAAGPGRTYIAATAVPLLALRPAADGAPAEGTAEATLALTRRQALRLIGAESFARRLTLLPGG
jgi:Flp pilus assembly protein CpaB